MIIYLILLLVILFLLCALSMIWPPDSPWAPWWRTSDETARAMCKLADVGKNDIVYDLGSGDGGSLIIAAKEFGSKGVGIEIDPLRFFISKVLIKVKGLSSKIQVSKKNFFEQDLSNASVIFVYLVPKTLERLKPKFLRELKPGTRIVSFKYQINLPFQRFDKNHKIYLYKIPNL